MTLFLKNLLFTLVVPGTIAVYAPLWLLRRAQPVESVWSPLAGALFVLGGAGYLWCVWHFARHGRGTPAPIDPPRSLVVRGPYRVVRNPMYLSVLLLHLGWAILYQSGLVLLFAAGVFTAVHLFVVLYEEPHLGKRFGGEYERYRARVGRWLPRPKRADAP